MAHPALSQMCCIVQVSWSKRTLSGPWHSGHDSRTRQASAVLGSAGSTPRLNLLPSWEGAGLWILIGGVGLLTVLVAGMLE